RTRLERRQTMLTGGVPEFQSLGDLLGHANVVARHFQRHIRRKRRRSSLRITHALVKCRKRRPRTDDAQIDRPAPRLSKITLRRAHHLAAKACPLLRWTTPKHPKIPPLAAHPHVTAPRQPRRVFCN